MNNIKPALQDISILKEIRETSGTLGRTAYLVGGYVRDLILDRTSKDIDILVVGDGISFAKELQKKLGKNAYLSVFKNFGTAQLKFKNQEIEFVGARKESYQQDSRKPFVEEGTLEDDLKRRDFTINALAISLISEDFGEVIDLFGGMDDIENKIIRTPLNPEITFSDDPLRMMRAIRFASQLKFSIHPETLQAISNQKDRIKIISGERISDELNKIILSTQPSVGFKLLFHTGLLDIIFPELVALQGTKTIDNKSHKDNFFHTLQVLDNVANNSDNLWLRWSAILHDIGKPASQRFDKDLGWTFHGHEVIGERMVPGIFQRLRLPLNEKMKYVQKLVSLHLRPIALTKVVTDSAIRRLIVDAGDDLEDLLILCKADVTSKNPEKVKRYLNRFDEVWIRIQEVEEKDRLRNWSPPITGDIIMKTFNIPPSRVVGTIKEQIKEAILNGDIPNEYEAAYNLMLQIGAELDLK